MQTTITAAGGSYLITRDYNSARLPDSLTYPASTGNPLRVRYGYDHGLLESRTASVGSTDHQDPSFSWDAGGNLQNGTDQTQERSPMTRKTSVIMAMGVVLLLPGCLSTVGGQTAIYPMDWPSLIERSDCTQVSGKFQNRALDSTVIGGVGGAVLLSDLLQQAYMNEAYGPVTTASVDSVVRIAERLGTFSTSINAVHSDRSIPGYGRWSCDRDGWVLIRFPEIDSAGEGQLHLRVIPELRLKLAVDGSLIVRLGSLESSMPFRRPRREAAAVLWFRFASVSSPVKHAD